MDSEIKPDPFRDAVRTNSPIKVEISVTAFDANAAHLTGSKQPLVIDIALQPQADSHGEAIVRALRHSADVAAARLGLLDLIGAPKAIDDLLNDMCSTAESIPELRGVIRNWASRLAGEYGLILHGSTPIETS